jgi:hypothetical protein
MTTTITASALNTTSDTYTTQISSADTDLTAGDLETICVDVKDYGSGSNAVYGAVDFTPPCDMRLWAMKILVWSGTATAKTLTVSLNAISVDQITVLDYTLGSVLATAVSLSVIGTSTQQVKYNDSATYITLVGGVTYRLAITAGTTNTADRVIGMLQLVTIPRRQ